jgi:PHD/YefM family antitoxin component YafN of YafNO toxin-antitoxin module
VLHDNAIVFSTLILEDDALITLTSKHVSIVKRTCLFMCVGFGFSFNVDAGGKTVLMTADNTTRPAVVDESANEGLQQTLNLNFSPENREKLRKALDDYAKSVDHDHDRIEERRRAMQESVEARFLDADNDGDGTIDRQEATEKLPQIARHFSQVDLNQDNVISLDELEEAQLRIVERRKAAEAALEAQKQEAAEAAVTVKPKNKQTANNTKKRAL